MAEGFGADVLCVAEVLLYNPNFGECWGGLAGQHHAFNGGLALHTKEVTDIAFSSSKVLKLDIDKIELFLACLYHDAGKTFDYVKNPSYGVTCYSLENGCALEPEPQYIASPHKRLIHHISRSAIMWSHAISNYPVLEHKYHDTVLHAILAHHGHREWGSPVAPKTKTAWLLHLSDGISARMNDADITDQLKRENK